MLANRYRTHFQHQRQCQHFVQGFLMLTLLLTLTVNRPLEKTRIFQSTHTNVPARHTHLENKIKLAFLNLLLTLTLSTGDDLKVPELEASDLGVTLTPVTLSLRFKLDLPKFKEHDLIFFCDLFYFHNIS